MDMLNSVRMFTGSKYISDNQQVVDDVNVTRTQYEENIPELMGVKHLGEEISSVHLDGKKNHHHKMTEKEVKKMTQDLNNTMREQAIELRFRWYKKLGRMSVMMVDINTNKTIKSFPPETLMKELEQAREWQGKFLDKKI